MSTFGGVIDEFPDIRGMSYPINSRCLYLICTVDYFRPIRGRRPLLTGFLSHIHSDHLTGLDTYKGPL
jgi:DNA cross-link repair 1C protein